MAAFQSDDWLLGGIIGLIEMNLPVFVSYQSFNNISLSLHFKEQRGLTPLMTRRTDGELKTSQEA